MPFLSALAHWAPVPWEASGAGTAGRMTASGAGGQALVERRWDDAESRVVVRAVPLGERVPVGGASASRGGVEIDAIVEGQPCRGWCPCGWRSREMSGYAGDLQARSLWRDHRRDAHGER
jgi:hypothetical protein